MKPDLLTMMLGVETRDTDLEKAKSDNELSVARSIAFLKQSGLSAKDIQTDFLSITPDYRNSTVNPVFYSVLRTFTVTFRSVEVIDRLITGCIQNGANHVYGIDFRTSDLKKYRVQARELAVKAAREKAQQLASALGVELGSVVSINEYSYGGSANWYPGASYQRNGGASQNVVHSNNAAGDESATTMAAGEIPVSSTINIVFSIK